MEMVVARVMQFVMVMEMVKVMERLMGMDMVMAIVIEIDRVVIEMMMVMV